MHIAALDDAAWASPWRRLGCGEKVACSLALTGTALAAPAWHGSALIAAAATVLLLGWARIPARVLLLAISLPVASILLGVASIAIVIGADAGWGIGPFGVTPESLTRAAEVAGHSLAGTLSIFVLALSTPLVDLLSWLRRLHLPGPLLDLAGLMYRLVFTLAVSVFTLSAAYKRRHGAAVGLGWRRSWDNRGALALAIMTRTAHRAERLQHGLELRGDLDSFETLTPPRERSWKLLAVTAGIVAGTWLLVGLG